MLEKRVNLLGVFVDDISLDSALAIARCALEKNRVISFFTPNIEMISAVQDDGAKKRILNSASVAIPDGIGVKMLSCILGRHINNSLAGIELGEGLLGMAAKLGARVFLLGAREGIASLAAEKLQKRYRGLKVCGTHSGYFSPDNAGRVCELINSSRADILIVCQGFPSQERFVFEHGGELHSVKIFACLGGSLDVWSGTVKRAPSSFRALHLEWLWRIANEPKRIRRFVHSLAVFPLAFCTRIKKEGSKGMKAQKNAYNQTDVNP